MILIDIIGFQLISSQPRPNSHLVFIFPAGIVMYQVELLDFLTPSEPIEPV